MGALRKLFFFASFLILTCCGIYCVFICAKAGQTFSGNYVKVSSENTAFNTSEKENTNSKNQSSAKNTKSEKSNTSNSSNISTSQNTVAASSNENAKGKIIEKKVIGTGSSYSGVFIKNNTSKTVDIKSELLKPPAFRIENISKPQVLIVHTHTTESYMLQKRDYYTDSDATRSTDNEKNMVAVGEVLKQGLEKRGIAVVHACETHDYPEYTGSYDRAAQTVKKYLKQYPEIKVVIDLHRDSIQDNDGTKTAVTADINGKKAAQIMLVSGCEDGAVSGFPDWEKNLRLALRLQQSTENLYPGLARPILFTARKYNQHLTTGSLLIECGTEANTLDEAKYSASLLAHSLSVTLNLLRNE